MTTPSLDEAVRDHYRAESLDTDTLASLREQIAAASPEAPASRMATDRVAVAPTRSKRLWRVVASGVVMLVFAAALVLAWPAASGSLSAEAVAQEIALNHVKSLNPDVRARSFGDLARDLGKLDFAVVRPAGIGVEQIVGARYCSLGGEMAAQIRFRDGNARVCTLYQVQDTEAFRSVRNGTFESGGVRVRVWRERGLLMGLAEPITDV